MGERERCKQTVYPNDRWGAFHPHQCSKFATKDGYCKTHHPDTLAAKRRKVDEEYQLRVASLNAEKKSKDAMRLNAARYVWLRENHLQTGSDSWIRTGDDLDEAIDAGMEADRLSQSAVK